MKKEPRIGHITKGSILKDIGLSDQDVADMERDALCRDAQVARAQELLLAARARHEAVE